MKLLDWLIIELPKKGGWPCGAVEAQAFSHANGVVHFWGEDGNPVCKAMEVDGCRVEFIATVSMEDYLEASSCPSASEVFEKLSRPLIKWLNDNGHPHQTIIIDATSAVLYSGEKSITTEEFIKD